MEEIVVSVSAKIVECMVEPIGRQLCYLIYYNDNINGLRNQFAKLKIRQVDVQGLVQEAERNGEVILQTVQEWLRRVADALEELEKFLDDEVKANQMCFGGGSCPDLKSRYKLSRKAKKKTLVVDELLRDVKFDKVSRHAPPPTIGSRIMVGDLMVFESRKSIFNSIMEELRNEKVDIIGVFGMGGVGKTTLVKEIVKQAEEKLFDTIVMAAVSQTPDMRKIQGEIADILGLKFEEETEFGRAGRLSERIMKEKKILVILDDLWTRLDLGAIGIPSPNAHKGCKVLCTSRSQDVCSEMNTNVEFLIEVLSPTDSWNLFRRTAGDSVDSQDLLPIATKVSKECAGLPIAIVTVAMALKGKGIHIWSDALHQLKNSALINIKGMHKNVYSSLLLSYNFLESEEHRYIFLLCCLFPEDYDIPIENLVRYGMGLRLFQRVNKLKAARHRAHSLVDYLKTCCLLLDGKAKGFVKMHDIVRDFAISVVSKGQYEFLVRAAAGLEGWTELDTCGSHTAIGLLGNKFHDLPPGLDFPKLNLLMLGCDSESLKIPDTFFEHMKSLRVLDMRDMPILSLPPSIQCLKNLQTLSLENCRLRDISLIGELKDVLQILSFRSSTITELPKEIGLLTRLNLLDLTNCKQLTVIPAGVISSLSHLEDLYLMNSFESWGFEDPDTGRSNASLAELKHLSYLSSLEMHIPNVKLCPVDLLLENLIKFKISIAEKFKLYEKCPHQKTLKLELDQSITTYSGFNMLVESAEHLSLTNIKDLKDVLHASKRKGFQSLKWLEVNSCDGIEYLVNSTELISSTIFPLLEKLKLRFMGNLKEIFGGPGQVSLGNLTVVEVGSCGKLKNLFSQYTSRDFGKLQSLDVSNCESLEEVIAHNRKGVATSISEIVFPTLKSLDLWNLPNLTTFFRHENSSCSDDNGDIPTHPPLFNGKVLFPAFERLTLSYLRKVKKLWDQLLLPDSFSRLRVLKIEECHSLVIVFPSNLRQSLQNLEELSVSNCALVEVVCEVEGVFVDKIIFPQLRVLHLENLQMLTTFYQRNDTLETLANLNAITQLPLFNEKVLFLGLERLILSDLCKVKELWNQQLLPDNFSGLRDLTIEKCHSPIIVFPSNLRQSLQNLEQLSVSNCDLVEVVCEVEGVFDDEIIFPQLRVLHLENLQMLTSFYRRNDTLETLANLNAIKQQPLFNEKILFPALEWLTLSNLCKVKELWNQQLLPENFSRLRDLVIKKCHSLVIVFPSNLRQNLQNLEELSVSNCDLVEVVCEVEGVFDDEIIFPQLRVLYLENLQMLTSFYRRNDTLETLANLNAITQLPLFNEKVLFPALEELTLSNLYKVKEIWYRQLLLDSFSRLRVLKIEKCHSFVIVFPSNLRQSLQNLEELSVSNCDLVEVLCEVEGVFVDEIIFPQLRVLHLENLQMLTSFYQRNDTLETLANLNAIKQQPLFNEKLLLPNLEWLTLSGLDNVKEMGLHQLPPDYFCRLKFLSIGKFHNLISVIPSNLRQRLQNLEALYIKSCRLTNLFSTSALKGLLQLQSLDINSCEMMKEIVAIEIGEEEGILELPSLKYLRIRCCPTMRTFVSYGCPEAENLKAINKGFEEKKYQEDNPIGIEQSPFFNEKILFQNLLDLRIFQCNSFRNLFSPSALKGLPQLKGLVIDLCEKIKEIIATERGEEKATDTIVIPQLRTLRLQRLPELACVYWGNFTFECPSLKSLEIENCPKMRTFVCSGCIEVENLKAIDKGIEEEMEQEGNLVGITQESFFNNKVLLPTLENLKLRGLPSLKEIWPKQLPAESFCQLKILTVTKCDNLFRVFPCNLSLRLQMLKELRVKECDSVEEVLEEGQYSGDEVVIYNMESLELTNLPKLRNFYSGNLSLKLSSLKIVRLKDCPNMHTFSSGPVITPKLHVIKVNDNEKPLNGDLNSAIQQLFEVKEEKAGEEPVTAKGIHGEILE